MYEAMALLGCIFTGLLLSLAEPLTLVLLGPQWEASAVIFRGFAIVTIFFPLCAAASWLMISQGRGQDSLVAGFWTSLAILAAFVSAMPFGVNSVPVFYSISGLFIQVPIFFHIVGRTGPVRAKDLWAGLLWHLPVWVLTSIVSWLVCLRLQEQPAWINLLISGSAGLITGFCSVCALPRSRHVALNLVKTVIEITSSRRSSAT
jgi:PST family polysaccharide transporter